MANARFIRAVGTGHTFNRLTDSPGDLVSLADLPSTVDIHGSRATVAAGLRYGEVAVRLYEAGYALPNLASLPHIAVAGAVATGTHGSGVRLGGLATCVAAVELVGPDGSLRTVARGEPDFPGSVVALGAVGIVTRLTLDLVPAFEVRQLVHDDVPFGPLGDLLGSGYSVSLFTDWRASRFTQVWRKLVDDSPFPYPPADGPRHPVPGMPPEHCTGQLGVPGPWYDRLPHFRLGYTPSAGDELQSEYLVSTVDGDAALAALDRIRDTIAPVLLVCEVRAVAADEAWLSMAYRRDSVAFHFTWVPDVDRVAPVVYAIEDALAPFAPRPHWGKVYRLDPAARYERYADFRALCRRVDPDGKFGNEYL